MTHPQLTRRQAEVLRARCETGSRAEAAVRLGITLWAVHRRIRYIRERCGCRDEAQACWQHRVELEAVQ